MLDYFTFTEAATSIRGFRDPSDQVTNFIAESLLQTLTSILWLAASLLHSDISIYSQQAWIAQVKISGINAKSYPFCVIR